MPILLVAMLVGLVGQLVDGALGMAYGVTCSTFLLTLGVAPAMISYSVKVSEIFTTGISGVSHLFHQNVNRALFGKSQFPGSWEGSPEPTFFRTFPARSSSPGSASTSS